MDKKNTAIYLDMDGVLADFFSEYAKLAGVTTGTYRDIPPAKVDPTLNKMVGTDFFARLPMFKTVPQLMKLVLSYVDSYSICSSPLRGDHKNSEKHKRDWIAKHLNPQPKDIVITGRKHKWATQPDGTPNILIDDRGKNISDWIAAGGYGIKYQADEDSLETVKMGLDRFFKGDVEEEPKKETWLESYEKELDKIISKENFADGKNPGRKGLSKRVGIPKNATLGQLEKIAKSSSGERRRMAQWQLNMRRGKKK